MLFLTKAQFSNNNNNYERGKSNNQDDNNDSIFEQVLSSDYRNSNNRKQSRYDNQKQTSTQDQRSQYSRKFSKKDELQHSDNLYGNQRGRGRGRGRGGRGRGRFNDLFNDSFNRQQQSNYDESYTSRGRSRGRGRGRGRAGRGGDGDRLTRAEMEQIDRELLGEDQGQEEDEASQKKIKGRRNRKEKKQPWNSGIIQEENLSYRDEAYRGANDWTGMNRYNDFDRDMEFTTMIRTDDEDEGEDEEEDGEQEDFKRGNRGYDKYREKDNTRMRDKFNNNKNTFVGEADKADAIINFQEEKFEDDVITEIDKDIEDDEEGDDLFEVMHAYDLDNSKKKKNRLSMFADNDEDEDDDASEELDFESITAFDEDVFRYNSTTKKLKYNDKAIKDIDLWGDGSADDMEDEDEGDMYGEDEDEEDREDMVFVQQDTEDEEEDESLESSKKIEKKQKQSGQQDTDTVTVNQFSKYSSFNQVHVEEKGKEKPFLIPRNAYNEQVFMKKLNPFFRMLRSNFDFYPEEQKLQIGPVPSIGLGLITKYPIDKGEELLRIPETMILDAESALKDSVMKKQMLEAGLSEKAILAVYLASIMQMRGSKWSAKQRWAGYVKAMPQRSGAFGEWGARKHRSFLRHILRIPDFIEEGKKICEEFQQYHSQVEKYKSLIEIRDERQKKAFIPATMDWCFGTVDARAIRFGNDGRLGLVPFMDFFNHDPNALETIKWDPETRSLYVVAERYYNRGEEIKINFYGSENSRTLFLRHGFTTRAMQNPNDRFPVEFTLSKNEIFYEEKLKFLKEVIGAEQEPITIQLRMNELNEELLRYCCFAASTPPTAEDIPTYGQKIIQKGEYEDMEEKILIGGFNRFIETLKNSGSKRVQQLEETDEQKVPEAMLANVIRRFVDWQNRRVVFMHEKWVKGFAADVRIRELKILNSNTRVAREKLIALKQLESEEVAKLETPKLGWDLRDEYAFQKYKSRNIGSFGFVGVRDFI